jgi:hypothetical protein
MKCVYILLFTLLLSSCIQTEDDKAAPLLSKIDSLYEHGSYHEALDSIFALREHHPKAIASRKKALRIWQEASLKLAQKDVGLTDSALQATLHNIETETSLLKANKLRVKRDSLKARYEAMCGVVRMIRIRMKQ